MSSNPTPLDLRLTALRNAEWLSFHTEFRTVIEVDPSPGPAALGVGTALWSAWTTEYANAQASFAFERASALTKLITEADHTRDQAFSDLHSAVLAYRHSPDASLRLAAERILTFLKNEKDIAQNTLPGESSLIANIDIAFTGPLSGYIGQLQLTPWYERLMTTQQAFLDLWRQRTDETAALTALRMSQERPKLDLLYHHALGAIQAATYGAASTAAAECITRLNTVIIKYKEIVSRRSGDTPEPPPESPASTAADLEVLPSLPLLENTRN
jgi:hypothetical protein